MEGLESIVGNQAALISCKDVWGLEFCVKDTIPKNFFHHFLFRGLAVGASYVVRFLNFGNCLTFTVLSASCRGSGRYVRSTIFRHQMTIFGKICMKMRPASFTSFGQIIAIKQKLRSKLGNRFTRFHHKSLLCCLSKCHCVA